MTAFALLAAWVVSVPVPWEMKPPPAEPVRHKGLAITVRPAKKFFGPRDDIILEIDFQNETLSARFLGVTEGPAGQTVGFYEFTIRDPEAEKTWQVGSDPNATPPNAAAQLGLYNVQPGKTLTTRVHVLSPGRRFWQGGTEKAPEKAASQLPPGRYEVIVTLKMPDGVVQTKPAKFFVNEK